MDDPRFKYEPYPMLKIGRATRFTIRRTSVPQCSSIPVRSRQSRPLPHCVIRQRMSMPKSIRAWGLPACDAKYSGRLPPKMDVRSRRQVAWPSGATYELSLSNITALNTDVQ
eukprot:9495138-Pyramimonas_sp.AAC.1